MAKEKFSVIFEPLSKEEDFNSDLLRINGQNVSQQAQKAYQAWAKQAVFADFIQRFSSCFCEVIIGKQNGKIIAAATMQYMPSLGNSFYTTAYALNIAVDKNWQRQGIGLQLMNYLKRRAKEKQAQGGIILLCQPDKAAFYEKAGFIKSPLCAMRYKKEENNGQPS